MPVGLYRVAPEAGLIDVNPAFRLMFGVTETEDISAASVQALVIHDGMETIADGLYRCAGPTALTMVPPPQLKREVEVLLHVVFRPVVRRDEAADLKQAA